MILEVVPPEQADAGALPEISDLLSIVFPKRRPWPDVLRWFYLDHPRGRAFWVNVRDDDGRLIGHSGLMPMTPLDDPRLGTLPVWFSLDTAMLPGSKLPGAMVLALRTLLKQVAGRGPSFVLGVANASSFTLFHRLLGFASPGPLTLRFLSPGRIPRPGAPRALALDEAFLRWRVVRPGARVYAARGGSALLRRFVHGGLPVDGILTVDAPQAALPLAPRPVWSLAPGLYATFGAAREPGWEVPAALRPSPLHYLCRSLAPDVRNEDLAAHLATRRFEFVDFDVL